MTMADAIRLIFSYTADGTVKLIHSYRADMAIPLNESVAHAPGHHLVAKDARGKEVFRIGARGLFVDFHEAYSKDGTIKNIPAPPDGVFQAVVPYHKDLEHIAVTHVEHHGPKLDPDLQRGTLTLPTREIELTRFAIDKKLHRHPHAIATVRGD